MEQVVQEDELASIGGMKRWPKLEKAGLSPSGSFLSSFGASFAHMQFKHKNKLRLPS